MHQILAKDVFECVDFKNCTYIFVCKTIYAYKDISIIFEIYTFKNILGQNLMGIQCKVMGLYVKM